MGEKVLVIRRDTLFRRGEKPHGFAVDRLEEYLDSIKEHSYFEERSKVEDDPGLKQIIPYMVVTDGRRILLLKRFEKQTEERLRNLYSIGVGGHINPVDDARKDPISAGLERELAEELKISQEPQIEALGYLNDDTNSVGSVHFGLVFRVTAPVEAVSVAEKDMMEGRFMTMEEIEAYVPEMETWSQLLYSYLSEFPNSVMKRGA
jgi:predicted NUDIX family phosphoesterase